MTSLVWPEKQVLSELDYTLDMSSDATDADPIVGVTASVRPSGGDELEISRPNNQDPLYVVGSSSVVVWLNKGIPGRVYLVRLEVTLESGRNFDVLVSLPMSPILGVTPFPAPSTGAFSTPVTWPVP